MTSRRTLANAIRALSMDAVQKANSGHPGAPMGMADIAEVLWNDHLRHNPTNPKWADRDRFVLSNGHGSMLIYSLLHLSGYDLPMEELASFRQLHSKCAGHPEYGYAPGVETTTGPLGQGITNGVGFAMAEKLMADQFNRPGHKIVDHHTYVFMGDGCLMEGISHEACALAGTWGLGKLIAFWDDNGISIDGHIEGWYTDDTVKRFEAYGWHVLSVDGHNPDEINKAISLAKDMASAPTLICCKTTIGFGSPNKAGTHECHGAALGQPEINLTKAALGWEHEAFVIPADVYAGWDAKEKGSKAEAAWDAKFAAYAAEYPELAAEFKRRMAGELPANWKEATDALIAETNAKAENLATRQSSQKVIGGLAPTLPEFLGGSADLTGSNLTSCSSFKHVHAKDPGNYISYGVREFGMYGIMNGMALHGGLLPFGGTFHMFSDYAKSALRMAALMKISSRFTIAASFGNVHGVYKPGNVKLTPTILRDSQKYVSEKFGVPANTLDFVFHGGSGSTAQEIAESISYGVVKMNIDTDTQWAYWNGIREFYLKNEGFLQGQIGNPTGEDSPNKKYYDPRVWVRAAQVSMVTRLEQAFAELNATNTL